MMKKILLICALFICYVSHAQWLQPNNSFGTIQNGINIKRFIGFPTGCGNPSLPVSADSALKKGGVYLDTCNHRFWFYDPKTLAWDTLGKGGGGGGGNNFANANLTFSGNRVHDAGGYSGQIKNFSHFTFGDTITVGSKSQQFAINNSSGRNLFVGNGQISKLFSGNLVSNSDSSFFNIISVTDTVNHSLTTSEYVDPPVAALGIVREDVVNVTGLNLETGYTLKVDKIWNINNADSTHLSPSTSDFVGVNRSALVVRNDTSNNKNRIITSGNSPFDWDANFVGLSSMNVLTSSGNSTRLKGYWAGHTSYILGTASRDTVDNWIAFYSTNAQSGGPHIKKYFHFASNAINPIADSIWFLHQIPGEHGYSYIDGNLKIGGGSTDGSGHVTGTAETVFKLNVQGKGNFSDTLNITSMGTSDSSNRAASTKFVKQIIAGLPAGFSNPMTSPNDLIIGGTAGAPTRLAMGSPGLALINNGGNLGWGGTAWNGVFATQSDANGTGITLANTSSVLENYYGSGAATWTLPLISTMSSTNVAFTFSNVGTGNLTIQRQGGSDQINYHGALVTSIVIAPGQSATLRVTQSNWTILWDGYDPNQVSTTGSYANPAWVTSLVWSKITSTPTTVSGYGITDAVNAVGTINSQSKSSNGGVRSGNTIVFQTADATFPGLESAADKQRSDSNRVITKDKLLDSLAWKRNDSLFEIKSIKVKTNDGTAATASGTDSTLIETLPVINAASGGTGQSSYAQGDVLYASASTTISKLSAGNNGQILTTQGASANPLWNDPTSMNDSKAFQMLGSPVKAQTVGVTYTQMSGRQNINSQEVDFMAVYIPSACTITGVKFWMGTQGSYTANNHNRAGLYSIDTSSGTLTQVDTSADNGNLWKAAQGMITVTFAHTYSVTAPGTYYVAFIYSSSAQTTQPQLGTGATMTLAATSTADFPHSIKFICTTTGQTDLPLTTQLMSGTGTQNIRYWAELY